jgi:MFS family permease
MIEAMESSTNINTTALEPKESKEPNEHPLKPTLSFSQEAPGAGPPITPVSTTRTNEHDAHVSFPEGGRQAWAVTLGGFCAFFAAFELANSTGSFQNWVSLHQLQSQSHAAIGWIFGLNAFITLFCGLVIGPVCDAVGPWIPLCTGAALSILFWGVLGVCTTYWHFLIAVGLLAGLSSSLLFVSAVITVGQYFSVRRGLATGAAFSGGSVGGIVVPIILQSLLPKLGWAWATRVVGLVTLVLVVAACLLCRPRLPCSKKPTSFSTIMPNFNTYRSPTFTATSFGMFFLDIALFIPLAYLPSYALAKGLSTTTSYRCLTYLNVGSCIGRWVPAYASDKLGRFNTMLVTVALCGISTLAIWLPAGPTTLGLIVYAIVFGFASGSNLSLGPVCVGQLCKIHEYGRYYTTATFFACFGYVMVEKQNLLVACPCLWSSPDMVLT